MALFQNSLRSVTLLLATSAVDFTVNQPPLSLFLFFFFSTTSSQHTLSCILDNIHRSATLSTFNGNQVPEDVFPRILPLEELRAPLSKAAATAQVCILQRPLPNYLCPKEFDMHSGQARLEVLPRPGGLPTSRHELWNEGGDPEILPGRP